jgi:hypothetical protein
MTDYTRSESHPETLAEMALGVLDPEERTTVLSHLASCPACREELLALSAVADRLAAQAPPAEPPAGFEDRVLARIEIPAQGRPLAMLGASRTPRARAALRTYRPLGSRRSVSWKHLAAAAAAAAVLLGAGVAIGSAATGTSSTVAGATTGGWSASLLVGPSGPVGRVFYDSDSQAWMSMGISAGYVGTLRCELVSPTGKVIVLGTFQVTSQGGYWATNIPASARGANTVRLVDTSGKMVATATVK